MRPDSSYACGARRSSAPAAVWSALHTADLVVVIAASGCGLVADAIHRELELRPGMHVLPLLHPACGAPAGPAAALERLRCLFEPDAAESPCGTRGVLLCREFDRVVVGGGREQFERMIELLGAGLGERVPARRRIHKAVLVGSEALLDQLQLLFSRMPEAVRFRYILVH